MRLDGRMARPDRRDAAAKVAGRNVPEKNGWTSGPDGPEVDATAEADDKEGVSLSSLSNDQLISDASFSVPLEWRAQLGSDESEKKDVIYIFGLIINKRRDTYRLLPGYRQGSTSGGKQRCNNEKVNRNGSLPSWGIVSITQLDGWLRMQSCKAAAAAEKLEGNPWCTWRNYRDSRVRHADRSQGTGMQRVKRDASMQPGNRGGKSCRKRRY
jgi:hypothetical protein